MQSTSFVPVSGEDSDMVTIEHIEQRAIAYAKAEACLECKKRFFCKQRCKKFKNIRRYFEIGARDQHNVEKRFRKNNIQQKPSADASGTGADKR